MKLLFALVASLGLGFLYFYPASSSDPSPNPKEQILIQTILQQIQDNMYHPKAIDDTFSKEVYQGFLAEIDPHKRFLTQKDISQLEAFQTTIDDEAKAGAYDFFNKSLKLLEAGIANAQTYCTRSLSKNIDLTIDERMETEGSKLPFASDSKDLENRWQKIGQHKVLEYLYDLENQQMQNGGTKTLEQLKKEATNLAIPFFEQQFARLHRITRANRLDTYLNLFMTINGPHNGFLSPKEKESFDANLSKSLQGIGVSLEPDKEYIKITDILPGGPASKSKDLEINDLIVRIAQAGETPVDVTGFYLEEVTPLLRGPKGTEVTLTVKKPDGSLKTVSLVRDLVIMEAGLAKSLLLQEENLGETIGYIRLPRFYIDFSREDGPRCSNDIYKEIEKLKKSQVKGIIFDLRDNQGGSLMETNKMLGSLIEKGPLVQREAQDGSLRTLEDTDESVQYDGEIIVLVNKNSGSASELFSGTLQDYDRAVIVGSESTFGKGTVQRMLNLDSDIADSTLAPLGNLKITIGKFYRVSGASTQLKGVEPDIVLPDKNSFIKVGEKAQKYPLPWSEIAKLEYSQTVNTNPNLEKVKALSQQRIKESPQFKLVLENAQRWKQLQDNTIIDLNYEKFKQNAAARQEEAAKYDSIFAPLPSLKISNNPDDLPSIQEDPLRQASNEEWIKTIQQDGYVAECLWIMHDLIKQ